MSEQPADLLARDDLAGLVAAVRDLDEPEDGARCIDQIRLLEELRAVTAATQARITAKFVAVQREQNLADGVPRARAERGVAAQVGLAQWGSPRQ